MQPQFQGGGYLASWGQRVGATIVDGLIFWVIVAIAEADNAQTIVVLAGIAALAYQFLMIGNGGQTIGNKAVGTRVVDANTGAPADYRRAGLRLVGQFLVDGLGSLLVILPFLDVLWPIWDRQNQTLHDKFAGTVVLVDSTRR